MALNLLQKAKQKRDSIKRLRKAAGWDNNQLLIPNHYLFNNIDAIVCYLR